MSKHNNVNPDYYKTAGRERQSEQDMHTETPHRESEQRPGQTGTRNFIPGAAPVGQSKRKSSGNPRRRS